MLNDRAWHDPRALWHPCTQMGRIAAVPPLRIVRGDGPWLVDEDGRRYFDAISSWWVNLFGHGFAPIRQALIEQLHTLEHVMLAGCTHPPARELAARLSDLTAGALGHAFFASDGASAVEIALKMSFHYWRNVGQEQRRAYVRVAGGYHGETLGALAVTDVPVFRHTYAPLLAHSWVVPSPDARAAAPGQSAADVAAQALRAAETVLREQAEQIAAVVVEPLVQCAAGMAMHHPDYLRGLRALCTRYGVHLIADEIAVGFGRTGTLLAWEQALPPAATAADWPDFLCLSKGLTGGFLPLSAVLTRSAVYAAFFDDAVARGFLHSHSYTGNPLACRAALAVLDTFARQDVLEVNRQRAHWLAEAFTPLATDPRLHAPRQCGLIWAADVRPEFAGAHWAERVHLAAREHELLLRPIGHTVYVMPPYAFDRAQAQWLARQVAAAVAQACTPASQEGGAEDVHVA